MSEYVEKCPCCNSHSLEVTQHDWGEERRCELCGFAVAPSLPTQAHVGNAVAFVSAACSWFDEKRLDMPLPDQFEEHLARAVRSGAGALVFAGERKVSREEAEKLANEFQAEVTDRFYVREEEKDGSRESRAQVEEPGEQVTIRLPQEACRKLRETPEPDAGGEEGEAAALAVRASIVENDGAMGRYRRREFLKLAAGASAGAWLAGRRAPAAEGSARPNILWITVEDMSPNLGCYGDAYAGAPSIDRLAAESVRYTNAFATAPVSSPARSCLITGVYASSLGTMNLRSTFPIPGRIAGFPSYLRKAGYYCTNNVKTDYNTSSIGAIVKASWDACSTKAHWRGRRKGRPFFAVFNDTVTHQSRSMVWPYAEFRRKVQNRLPAARRHDPARAPVPPYYPDTPVVRRTVARYYDCVSVMDGNTGKLLGQLDEDGLADDTIVFFYSDHGAGMPRHKRLILDSGLRVPLLVRFGRNCAHLAPGGPGEALDRLVSFVDFAPTVLSLVGLPIPKHMQGEPFLGPAATKPRARIYGARDRVDEAYDLARCVRDGNWLYVRNYMPHVSYNQPSWYSDLGEIRRDITALSRAGGLGTPAQKHYAGPTRPLEELYDTANDPHQIRNLAGSGDQKARLASMRGLLRAWMIETRDLGFLPECDIARRSAGSTPYDAARRRDAYPIERVIAAAELVGTGPASMDAQVGLLRDADSAVRYWAAVGLRALGEEARPAARALTTAMADGSPAVRIEAAWALVEFGNGGEALGLLARELEGANVKAATRAARALEMLGERARPVLATMRRVLKPPRGGRRPPIYVRFALDAAVKALTGGT